MSDTPNNDEEGKTSDAVVVGISLGDGKIEVDGRYYGLPYRNSDVVPASCRRPKEAMTTNTPAPPSITMPPETQASPTCHLTGNDALRANVKAITMIVVDAVMSYHEVPDEERPNLDQAIHEMANNVHGIMAAVPAGVTSIYGKPAFVRDSVRLFDALLKIQMSIGVADFTEQDAEDISAVVVAAQEIGKGMEMARTKFNPLRSL
jgi:hypothetical protein